MNNKRRGEKIESKKVEKDFDTGVDFTNILGAAFSHESLASNFFVLRFKVCTFLAQKYWLKSRAYNVGEIDSRKAGKKVKNWTICIRFSYIGDIIA